MQSPQKINFREVRDFGEVIDATFIFLRYNGLSILKALLTICAPLILVGGFMIGSQFGTLFSGVGDEASGLYAFLKIFGYIPLFAGILLFNPIILSYFDLYITSDKQDFSVREIWANSLHFVFPVLFTSIVATTLIFISSFLFFIPGVFVAVSLSFIFFAVTIEDKGVFDSVSRSFEIIKENWWSTFGLILIMIIIEIAIALSIQFPVDIIYEFLNLSNFEISMEVGKTNTIGIVLLVVQQIISFLMLVLHLILLTALAFKYFSIVEQKEGVGVLQKVEAFDIGEDALFDPLYNQP